MQPFRYHVFACEQQKPEGAPSCCARGSSKVIEALRREVVQRGFDDRVQITACGSLGLCESGPNIVVYPEGVWYSGVKPEDVPEIAQSHFGEGVPVQRLMRTDAGAARAEMAANRDKRMAAMRAREAAGVLPDDLNDRIRSFQESRVILTALELDLFTALEGGSRPESVAARIEADPRATEMLLNALAALGLVEKADGVYRNSFVANEFFVRNAPHYARYALLHTANLWERWSKLTGCVRTGKPASGGPRSEDATEAFIAAMQRNATERAPHVLRAVGAVEGRMLDVGGGSGAYSIAFALANPGLRAEILDAPEVAPLTRRYVEIAGLQDRVSVRTGDLTRDALGEGYNLVFLSAICHMLGEAENADLLRRCHAALAPGGRIVIQDFILEPGKTAPKSAALFSLNMLVGTESGSSYSGPEYTRWLEAAGFADIQHVRLPGPTGLLIGRRP